MVQYRVFDQERWMSMLDQKMANRRERILEAARRLIETRGYEGLTMRNLAAESDVTVPTLYNLVGNKEQVFFEAIEDQTRVFVASLDRTHGDLISLIEATVRHLVRRPRYYRALLLVLSNSEGADSARRHVGRAVADQIAGSLSELADAGKLADWVDRDALAQRLQAHLDMASLEWARGSLTAGSFRAAALFDLAIAMLGITTGSHHSTYKGIIVEHQADALRRSQRNGESGQAA
jgi:AcrR family transcriptional regulator